MTEFKTGTQTKKDREKHSGNVFKVVEKEDHSIDFIVLKEETGNHVYYPAKGKVAQYLQPIQPGEHISFEAVLEKDETKTIVWVLAWERVHKAVHSTGDAKKIAENIVSSGQGKERTLDDIYREAEEKKKINPPPAGGNTPEGARDPTPEEIKWVREYLEKQGEVFAGQLSEPKSKVPSFLTDSQKKDMRIGYYSNLNTAAEIVKLAYDALPKKEKEGQSVSMIEAAVLQVAKNLHDWVEKQISGD